MEKKPSLAVLLMGKGSGDPEGESDKDETPGKAELDEHMHGAADELIEAVHSKDAGKVVESMKALHNLCAAHAEAGEDEPELHEGDDTDDHEAEMEAAGTDS